MLGSLQRLVQGLLVADSDAAVVALFVVAVPDVQALEQPVRRMAC